MTDSTASFFPPIVGELRAAIGRIPYRCAPRSHVVILYEFSVIDVFTDEQDEAEKRKGRDMSLLGWALVFLVVALIAAAFGFGGIATAAAGVAKILFLIFVAIFVVFLILALVGAGATA